MPTLSQTDLELLQGLAGRMIPASRAYDAPGADDPVIFADVAAALQVGPAPLGDLVAELAVDAGGDLEGLRQRHGAAFAAVIVAVAQCYYRDDRVMRSLGMEARPPFPKGYETPEGDWTLLDPVRGKGAIWRNAD